MLKLSHTGRPSDEINAELEAKRAEDVRWADGRTFGMIYDGGPSVHEVAERAALLYLHENALNTKALERRTSVRRRRRRRWQPTCLRRASRCCCS